MYRQENGFTLVEILVVIGIIAVLAAMLLPSLGSARARAQMMTCMNNLKQLGHAANQYTAVYDGWLAGPNGITIGARGRGALNLPVSNGTLWPYYGNKETYICSRDGRREGTFTWSYSLNFASQLRNWRDTTTTPAERQRRGRHITDIMYTSKMKYFVEENTDRKVMSPFGYVGVINDALFCFGDYVGAQHGNVVAVNYVDGHAGSVPAFTIENGPFFRTEALSAD